MAGDEEGYAWLEKQYDDATTFAKIQPGETSADGSEPVEPVPDGIRGILSRAFGRR